MKPNIRFEQKQIGTFLAALLMFAGIIVTANCGAARPVKYYTLNPAPTPEPSVSVENSAPLPVTILVGRINASHLYLDSPIVYSSGGVELGTYPSHRWAEVPTEMVEAMLMQSLRSKGKFRSVARIGSSAKGDYILRGHLYALEEVDSPSLAARFSLSLELFQPKTGVVVWTQSYSHDEPVNHKTVSAIVEALRQNVLAGLDQLTSSLDAYVSTRAAH
ncbi:MAG TPA: ABC-type transport auxiliary lipoprotein family protein [Candidatus Dormibacteraeota bacterium]|nr:ABC-type transport auxiliary lipoprotein family protein [Candidatus Dormibacteraeota bacterium]